MSGHSKWANIKRRKAVVDAQKGKIFSRLAREITVAARQGGGNPDANFRLATAVERARAENLPSGNIERAIARGVGGGDDTNYEELQYEGYGPGGVAILLQVMTDNRNRTAADIRHLFSKYGGSLGETGSVGWMFQRRARVRVRAHDEEELLLTAADVGAEDVEPEEEGFFSVYGKPEDLRALRQGLIAAGVDVVAAEFTMDPTVRADVGVADQDKVLSLLDALDEHDDVQEVYTSADFGEEGANA
ncbi:MAG: YebC/PmpR family DNA-binding transcriptional regulator [Thermaerobacter sp.]|nr:YebC/PmpR family DNA-binding transcriptional regulator [Thermaerobacter sp.]